MKKRLKFILIILLVAVIAVIATLYLCQKQKELDTKIKVSGNIEGDEVRLSFRVPGQILELLTDEGRVVKKGDVVARLKTDELTKIRDSAEAALKAAEHKLALDKLNYERAETLFRDGYISAQDRDEAKTGFEVDAANVKTLQASLELAKVRLGFAELVSPLDGFIVVKSALPGEEVQAGATVFTVVDLNYLWVTAYINETDLGRVRLNQEADVIIDTYPDKKYRGRVSFISSESEFTPKFIQTTEERVKLVYRIKIRVDNPNLELKPGMPADAYLAE